MYVGVRGFHVYWMPTTGEHLSCQTEDSNAFDPYAVAITSANVIGHVPWKISAAGVLRLYTYFGKKIKVNVTETKVGIKSCRFY